MWIFLVGCSEIGLFGERADAPRPGLDVSEACKLLEDAPYVLVNHGLHECLSSAGDAGDLDGDGADEVWVASTCFSQDQNEGVVLWVASVDPDHQRVALDGRASMTVLAYSEDPAVIGGDVVAVADRSGDGLRELAIPAAPTLDGAYGRLAIFDSGRVGSLRLSDADRTVEAVGVGPRLHADVDVTGDARDDLVAGGFDDAGSAVWVIDQVGRGTAHIDQVEVATVVGWAQEVEWAAGDLDGDGIGDLAADEPSELGVRLLAGPLSGAIGTDAYDARLDFSDTRGHLTLLAAGDGDEDGREDLLVASWQGAWLVDRWAGPSTVVDAAHATFVDERLTSFGYATPRRVGDVDLDGADDLAFLLWAGTGPYANLGVIAFGPFSGTVDLDPAMKFLGGHGPVDITRVGDIDGDGVRDLAVVNDDGDVGAAYLFPLGEPLLGSVTDG